MARRVLVLGGTGFVGGCAARTLVAAGDEVVVVGRGERTGPAGTSFHAADRDDPAALARVLEGERFDVTLDFAAYDRPGVEALLGVRGLEPGRYVMISTGQVCLVGVGATIPFREEDGATELMPEPAADTRDHRQWVYGTGKRRAEAAVAAARRERGLDAVIVRLPVVLGAGDPTLRLWAYIERLRDGGPLLVHDGGTKPVRFLWVEDVPRALGRLLERWPPRESVYHLAQPDMVPLRHMLALLAKAIDCPLDIVPVTAAGLDAAGIGYECSTFSGAWVSVLDPGRALRDWGFEGTPLDGYLGDVARAHLEHPPAESHPGYAQRPQERAYARTLESGV